MNVVLKSHQVTLPHGIFQQSDGTALSQLSLHQVQLKQRGIVIANIDEAAPFFKLTDKICEEGLGLIVLDVNSSDLPPKHQRVKFPAICAETGEPMICHGALFQLGKLPVNRLLPHDMIKVDQIATCVVRAVVYQDQYQHDWQTFISSPVKMLMQLPEFRQLSKDSVLDVFDRQWLTKKYQRARPDQCDMFTATFRTTMEAGKILLDNNSKGGVYYEPRNATGLQPDEGYRAIWIPKLSYQEVLAVQQTRKVPTWITRTGDRFGLRAATSNAEQVHKEYKPNTTYLDSSQAKQYRISPVPFGTTKQSLQKVFDQWEWPARPVQVMGRSDDQQGVVWLAQATKCPAHWIYTTDQGDLLITEHEVKRMEPNNRAGNPVASTRTLQHLSQVRKPNHEVQDTKQDPWLHRDPWTQYVPINQMQPNKMAEIEEAVHKKVMATMQEQGMSSTASDASMDEGVQHRVATLEKQMSELQGNVQQLTGTVSVHHQQQTHHNAQVTSQIQAVQATQSGLQSAIENKLEEQMQRIEALLKTEKRQKTSSE